VNPKETFKNNKKMHIITSLIWIQHSTTFTQCTKAIKYP